MNAYTAPITGPYLEALRVGLEGARLRQRPADHAEQWRRYRHRRGEPVSGPHGGIRAGGRRAGGGLFCRGARARSPVVFRHGRHHRQGLHHRGPPAARGRRLRGRPHLSLQIRQRPADPDSVGRHDRDRRRRRQHRLGQRSRTAQGGTAQRGFDVPGRSATAAAAKSDRYRCRPCARLSQRRQFSRRRHEARSRRRQNCSLPSLPPRSAPRPWMRRPESTAWSANR